MAVHQVFEQDGEVREAVLRLRVPTSLAVPHPLAVLALLHVVYRRDVRLVFLEKVLPVIWGHNLCSATLPLALHLVLHARRRRARLLVLGRLRVWLRRSLVLP